MLRGAARRLPPPFLTPGTCHPHCAARLIASLAPRLPHSHTHRSATRYHLNAKLVDACEQDVFNICSPYSEGIFEDDSHILTCLAANVTALRAECKRELSAAVRMQFKRYRIGSPLTAACDGDVTQVPLLSCLPPACRLPWPATKLPLTLWYTYAFH